MTSGLARPPVVPSERASGCPAPRPAGCVTPAAGRPGHACSRRALLLAGAPLPALAAALPAAANVLEDYVRDSNRPELSPEQAAVLLMDAQGTLAELKALAATAPDSRERFAARALLPGMAKRLRQVGKAAPVLAAYARGVTDREQVVSKLYGGSGGGASATDAVYAAIGSVVTISGRTIRKEAQASPALAEAALARIQELMAGLPRDLVAGAEALRAGRPPQQRRAVA